MDCTLQGDPPELLETRSTAQPSGGPGDPVGNTDKILAITDIISFKKNKSLLKTVTSDSDLT